MTSEKDEAKIAVVGSGNFTTRVLLPALPNTGLSRKVLVSKTGVTAAHAAKKFGFQNMSTDFSEVVNDDEIDTVVITTRHDLHAGMVCESLQAGKNVFVEKPLALNLDEINTVREAVMANPDLILMVGFNRRFSPHMTSLKEWTASVPGSKAILITVNAGAIPADHWTVSYTHLTLPTKA